MIDHLLYGLAWGLFGALHSITADARFKQRLEPILGKGYRLAYNLFAVVTLAAVWLFGKWLFPNPTQFHIPELLSYALYGVSLAGAIGLLIAARTYDLARFAGTAQWRNRAHDGFSEDEQLLDSGLHGRVRHPIYAFVFPLVWGMAQDELAAATAVWISVYLVIGARLEENRLIALYGPSYVAYRNRVPAFFPKLFGS